MGTFMHASEGEMVCTSTNVKIPYFNAPIYLENKTAVGKVDEILGPINQVYFTIKPQEGIVATSFKNGDKFYIGGDKLLPLERYISSRQTFYNTILTCFLDSCPSPSPRQAPLRSRSPLVAVAQEEVLVAIVDVGASPEEEVRHAEDRSAREEVPEVGPEAAALEAEEERVASLVAAAEDPSEVVAAEATKRIQGHLGTFKSAKHEGVKRQRRHGVMRPWTAWEMVRKEALFRKEAVHLMVYAVQDYFEYRREAKKLFQLHSF